MAILQTGPILGGAIDDEGSPEYILKSIDIPEEVESGKEFDIGLEICCNGKDSQICPLSDLRVVIKEKNPIGDRLSFWDFPILNLVSPMDTVYDEKQRVQLDDGRCSKEFEVTEGIVIDEQKKDTLHIDILLDNQALERANTSIVPNSDE